MCSTSGADTTWKPSSASSVRSASGTADRGSRTQPVRSNGPPRRPAERRAVHVRAEVRPRCQVRVEVDHGHRACTADTARSMGSARWVAAQRQHERGAFQQGPRAPLDGADRLVDAERVDGQVARVGHLLVREHRDLQRGVVRPQQPGGLPDVGRAEAGAGAVADPAVERHADDGHVGPLHVLQPGQAGEGGLPAVAGNRGGVHGPDGVTGDNPPNGLGQCHSPSMVCNSRSDAAMAACSDFRSRERDRTRYTRPDTSSPTTQE